MHKRKTHPSFKPLLVTILVTLVTTAALIFGITFADTAENALTMWVLRWLALPWGVLMLWVAWRLDKFYSRKRRIPWFAFGATLALTTPMAWLFACPAVNVVNASFPTGQDVVYIGPVTKLAAHSHKGTWSYELTLRDRATQESATLRISEAEYQHLAVGFSYQRQMKMGGLGIPFRRRW